MELKARLKQAAVDGLVLAVKYGVAVALVLGAAYFVLSDYQKVRNAAALGENSYRWILAGVQAGEIPDDWAKFKAAKVGAPRPAVPYGPVVPAATPIQK